MCQSKAPILNDHLWHIVRGHRGLGLLFAGQFGLGKQGEDKRYLAQREDGAHRLFRQGRAQWYVL